jgi:hypothetical protein
VVFFCIAAYACALQGEDAGTVVALSESDDSTAGEEPPPEMEANPEGSDGPPPQVMLGTTGYFHLSSKDKVPKFYELGEAPSTAGHKPDERISLAEASRSSVSWVRRLIQRPPCLATHWTPSSGGPLRSAF